MTINQIIELKITDIAYGGQGVGRAEDGVAVFVPFTAVGDVCKVEIVKTHERHREGRLLNLQTAGAGRVQPPCPWYGTCGGCCYQHLDYESQVIAKQLQLTAALTRIGKFAELPGLNPAVPAPAPFAYRNKISLEPVTSHDPADDKTPNCSFGYLDTTGVKVVPIDNCPLAVPAINKLLPVAFKAAGAKKKRGRGNYAEQRYPSKLTVRAGHDRTVFWLDKAAKNIPWLHEEIAGREVRVPAGSFWQVNNEVAAELVATVRNWLSESGMDELLLDVYCGVGAYSLAAGHLFKRAVLIEMQQSALAAARHNQMQWGLPEWEFLALRAEEALPPILRKNHKQLGKTAMIINPPRSGCPPSVLKTVCAAPPACLVYVSCNPATLARDLRQLGTVYKLERLAWFDMFPQTAHFETAVLLTTR